VKAFGITSKAPSPQFPGVASFVQAYGPKLQIDFWQILLAPAGVPKPVVDTIDSAVQEALADPEILKAWAASGMEPYAKELQTPAGAAKYLHSEIERWGQVVRDNKIEAPGN
jgi:tripartite-type tricarboxylate transporter receptor subunit TctC